METKNTPLLFQQELNTFYKDILNCEITHPPYRAGRVPETFFLRRRKGIDIYEDWGWDEVLDYINFEWNEYAIVRHDDKIKIKKWLDNVNTDNLTTIVNTDRVLRPEWWKFTESWTLWTFVISDYSIRADWHKLYIYTVTDYTTEIQWTVSVRKQLFVTEYTINLQNNISYVTANYTYRVKALENIITNGDNIVADISSGWKSLFVYLWDTGKFYQIAMWNAFDISSLSNNAEESELTLTWNVANVKDMLVAPSVSQLLFVSWDDKVYSWTFTYNNIWALETLDTPKDTWISWATFNWITCTIDWSKLYLASAWHIYQFNFWTPFIVSSLTDSTYTVDAKIDTETKTEAALALAMSADGLHLYLSQKSNSNIYYIAQLWFEHARTLITQNYNPNVNHSFKRGFQSAKWKKVAWGTIVETENPVTHKIIRTITDKVTWSMENASYKMTPTPAITGWASNGFVGNYIYLFGWATSATTGTSQGCAFPIIWSTDSNITVGVGWDAQPNQTTYAIFPQYWEVLAYIWGDGLYAIHYDWWGNNNTDAPFIWRYESIQSSVSVIDADRSNWMIYAILDNGWVVMSASKTNDWNYSLWWWYFSGYMNNSSYIWSISWALRIVPFNDIVVVFTKNWIYVIKKESMDVLGTTINTYTLDLAFSFLGIHSFHSVCSYNTWIYFLSNKKTFLSLNIEESYYNKYKITTEDLGINIQQWLDNIEENDPVSIAINTETIYMTWYWKDKSTIFQYSNYYSFWHRRETKLDIKHLTVDTHETYLWAVAYRYNLTDKKTDEWEREYEQHLRRFHWESDIFSLKTILYHQLYLWVNTDLNSSVYYKARLSSWLYEYNIPLSNASFLQKSSNLTAEKVLGNSILGYQTLWWNAEKYVIWTYLSDVDILEIPLGLTYSLLEIIVSWDFEIWGNIMWALVHDPHLTPYEDVVAYLDE